MMKVCALLLVAAAAVVKAQDGSASWGTDMDADDTAVVVQVTVETYTPEEATTATAALAAAIAPAAGTAPSPVVEIAATVSFASLDITTIAEGTTARTDFETEFKTSMATSIGGVTADKIIVDAITGSRRRLLDTRRMQSGATVNFHIVVPESVKTQAASLVARVDTSAVTVAGNAASGTLAPVVTRQPTINCAGAFSTCGADCADKTYTVSTAAVNGGIACPVADGDTQGCAAGHGDCPPAPTPVVTAPPASAGVITQTSAALAMATVAAAVALY